MRILHNDEEILGVETVDLTKWSTPCREDCPGIKCYPYYHTPHIPLYPVLCATCNKEQIYE